MPFSFLHPQIGFIRRFFSLCLFCFILLFMTGCLTFEEKIEIQKNGSAAIMIRAIIPEANMALIQHASLFPALFNQKEAEAYYASFNAGLKVQKYHNLKKNHFQEIEILVLCPDAEKGINSGAFGQIILKDSSNHLGDKELWVKMPDWKKKARTPEESAALGKRLESFSATLLLHVPTEIIDSNGEKDAFNQSHWTLDAHRLLQPNAPYPNELHARW